MLNPLIYDDIKVYIDEKTFRACSSWCASCKMKYYDIAFNGYIIKDTKKYNFSNGFFSAYDSCCICEPIVKEILCKIDLTHLRQKSLQFLHICLDDKIVNKIIPRGVKGYPYGDFFSPTNLFFCKKFLKYVRKKLYFKRLKYIPVPMDVFKYVISKY